MRFLFYLGHPAHFHLFKNLMATMKKNGDKIEICIKTKDVLSDLLKNSGWEFINIFAKQRKKNRLSLLKGLIEKDFKLFRLARKFKPDLMLGTSVEITHVGKLLKIPTYVFNEDDWDVVPEFAKLGYPLATRIVAPQCCRTGNWDYKKIGYNGYHELAYLHPLCFSPDFSKVPVAAKGAPYFIVRFSSLSAYHDKGKQGLDSLLVIKIIEKLSKKGRVFISSEATLPGELEKYRLHIDPLAIHDVMAFAELYLGDSQTMTAEAAVLGVPALRFNDFVGRISYLEELEHKFGLTFGYKTDEADAFLANLDFMLAHPRLKEEWVKRRSRMLAETIDVNVFFKNLISDFKRGEDKNELAS